MEFLKVHKRRSFKERMQIIGQLLNQKGQISVKDLVVSWGIVPHCAKMLLQWAPEFYPYAVFDESTQTLYIETRKGPTQTTSYVKSEEGQKID